MNKAAELLKKRDEKAIPHLEQYAPVWLVDEQVFENEEAVQFHIIFRHHLYGWVNRRYRYDGFNNVLYHKGQTALSEVDAAEIEATEPYINPVVADIPNAYGG
jgi:hypothetical protein